MTSSTGKGDRTVEAGSGWVAAGPGDILGTLEGRRAGDYRIVPEVGKKNRFGARFFRVFLSKGDRDSLEPACAGLYRRGSYPTYNWFEVIALGHRVPFASGEDVELNVQPHGLTHGLLLA
jgi:hypothetical protein